MDGSTMMPALKTETLSVSLLEQADDAAWTAYVNTHPTGSPFHTLAWRQAINAALGYDTPYLLAKRGSRIIGVLPLVHTKTRLFGNAMISTAFSVGGGVLCDDDETAHALAQEAISLSKQRGVECLELRSPTSVFDGWPTKAETYAGFAKTLDPDTEERLKAVPRKKRADIRKGIKANLLVDPYASIDVFYDLYARNLHALGTPIMPKKWYAALKKAFGDSCEVSAVIGPDGPTVALLSFYHGQTVYPYYVGANAAARKMHAFDHVYWTQMERAAERGITTYDFGRSKVGTGAADYKKHWGFEGVPLEYQFHLFGENTMPDLNPNNPKYARFVKVWQKLPFAATKALGPIIAQQMA